MSSAALLVIDIQRGAFDGVRCPPIDRADELLRNARSLVAAAHDAGVPVVFVQHCGEAGQALEHGSSHGDFHDHLAPLASDLVIQKRASSAFDGTDLQHKLRALQVTDLIVCGLQSELCLCSTSTAALALGYRVSVARDGHSTWPCEGQSASALSERVNHTLQSLGAVIETTASLAAALRAMTTGDVSPMRARPLQKYLGRCHCAAVRFEIETDFPELTMCDCSICRRKNALMVKVHESRFKLLAGEEALTEYQFHTMTARHFFCKVCGIYPFHRKRVTPDHLGINVFCLEDFDTTGIPVRQAVGAAMA